MMNFFKKTRKLWYFILPAILIASGVILNSYAAIQLMISKPNNLGSTSSVTTTEITPKSPQATPPVPVSPTISPTPVSPISEPESWPIRTGEPKLGHFPYAEGNTDQMMIIASYAQQEYQRFEKLAPETALALMKLIYAARDDGVWIVPVSGFRSIATQSQLFQAQIERRGSPEAAAKLSAPPGYSEHHTGYAVDFTDGHFPKEDITYNFANTDAFRWLNQHAIEFGFELSFPENNYQGVSYEPWHWRYVGTPNGMKIFAHAKP